VQVADCHYQILTVSTKNLIVTIADLYEDNQPGVFRHVLVATTNLFFFVFLPALIHIFPAVFQHIRTTFTAGDLERLCAVLQNMVTVPFQDDCSVFLLPSDAALTLLQDGVVHCVRLLQE
jgi:hypothetical protein